MSALETSPEEDQRESARELANAVRMDLARLRGNITYGNAEALRELYLNPPACVKNLYLYEPLLWAPGVREVKVSELGKAAVADGVNLLTTFSRSSERSRLWVLMNIHIHRSGRVSLRRTPCTFDEKGLPVAIQPKPKKTTVHTLISNVPLREAVWRWVNKGGVTWNEAAYHAGILKNTGLGDANELRRRLGLTGSPSAPAQSKVTVGTAIRICDALGLTYDEAGIPE